MSLKQRIIASDIKTPLCIITGINQTIKVIRFSLIAVFYEQKHRFL